MATVDLETIIDGDGHLFEDLEGIWDRMPPGYRERKFPMSRLFPPLDHLHSSHVATQPPGSFEPTGTDGWKAFLRDAGIDSTILYPTVALSYGRIASTEFAVAVTRAYNDWLFDAYLRNDPRFKGMALIPMQDPPAAVAELRRAVEDLGMCGAMLPSTGLKAHLGSREYWPIYAEAERLGCSLGVPRRMPRRHGARRLQRVPGRPRPRPSVRPDDLLLRHPHERHLRPPTPACESVSSRAA